MNGKGGGKLQRFFIVELRALALAVLAVQVCCRGRDLPFLQRSRIDGFVAEACSPSANSTTVVRRAKAAAQHTASGM